MKHLLKLGGMTPEEILHEIDARRLDGAVAEHIRELHNIVIHTIVRCSKQVAQIVWKHLRRRDARLLA